MPTQPATEPGRSRLSRYAPALGLALVILSAAAISAATYLRTSLKELTGRSVGVVEVEVLAKHYPALEPGQTFPRTHIDLKVLRSFKGALPEQFTLDTPGGIVGDTVSVVSDGPEFRKGERAIVFVKEPAKGLFMVQDLGLGKFNVIMRNGQKVVESPLCANAAQPKKVADQEDADSALLTKSVPYDTFTNLIETYAKNGTPEKDPARVAILLPNAQSSNHSTVPSAVEDLAAMQRETRAKQAWAFSALVLTLVSIGAAYWVHHRRKMKAAPVKSNNLMLILAASLAGGALLGTSTNAFVQFDQKTIWALDTPLTNKVANSKIIWKQSTSVSVTNSGVFSNVQSAFNKWEAVNLSRLAFTAGGSTANNNTSTSDGENVIAWNTSPSNDFSQNTLAICFSSFTVGTTSRFQDGDIIFNDRDFSWAPNAAGNAESVSLHEIGHFIGLNHSTSAQTVMFPFDSGFTQLSSDEVSAAQTLYPGPDTTGGGGPPPPPASTGPTALADASPKTGVAPQVVSFTGAGSTVGSTPIVSFEWDFGDGTEDTGAQVSHTYQENGTFTATLRVTDTDGNTSLSTVVITLGNNADPVKGAFKLNFKQPGKDSFSCTLFSEALFGIKAAKGTGTFEEGYLNIGDTPWIFIYDTEKAKNIDTQGIKLAVNDKKGTITISAKNADLVEVLGGHGAENDDIAGEQVPVPVIIWLGETLGIFISTDVPFSYKAKLDSGGSGKF